ncbi:MAG: GWxTD domain-containing protein [Candidatus Marinimicrobia bacterium]|jgi:GWxTD domain-containing protein|nr:GWxTD domain-containing protein [Candidatus Neomarinimicrobiota bacterium]MBT3675915.1 GWxTD domain-containing protein [Candidatus Neomarinimicrobiota bacterium]MBT3763200.1 GWxTD domain-containing protein [Candidatus Neomarinimicrobiota bacterium]MBT4069339.1 GWxTD domain-containing protein [Candidatus Neomarinimicrobiota bacterium]MBT4269950.1 GWxTD domain-containing protein [Candidatus Neomarinimicrobiota bacterium]
MKHYYKSIILISLALSNLIIAQRRPNNSRNREIIRQYGFTVFSVADENSDSIRVLSYVSIPNHVLQFVKTTNGFEAEYETTISLKRKKGKQVGRKNWSNTLVTDDYLESTSKKTMTIHHHEFKVPAGDYIISAEVLDKDSNDSGVRDKELKYSEHKGDLALYNPFFVDYLSGKWGLNENEIPMFQNLIGEKVTRTSVFVSGKIKPGPYILEVLVTNSKKKEIWKKSFQSKSEESFFHQRIIIPEEVAKQGLRKKVDIVLIQGNAKRKESVILSVNRSGISSSINDIAQAVENMRYILHDDEWKKLSKAKNTDKEALFIEYWSGRDPTPETPDNEVMNEYFSRVYYSNVNFKSYMPGWKTDMGMIYILFGPPDDLEIYNDPLSRIYSQRWHYYRINKYFDFIDENGFGDYRLSTPFFRGRSW